MKTKTLIPVNRTNHSRVHSYDLSNIAFGTNPTDHIFFAEYKNGGWREPRIEPFHDLTLSPIALCFHYGQTVFEGMKAYKLENGGISIFRPYNHHARLNKSLERMCMPPVPEDLFLDALETLIDLEKEWVPESPDASLYIRPFVIATEPRLGVKVSDEYLFAIVCMPLASYYASNLKVKVETEYIRAVEGGTGTVKCGGNYGAAFYPTQKAKKEGFDQVLWTDGVTKEFIEESGTMNVMFAIDGKLITPPLSGSILAGITRDSLITLAKDEGIETEERKISCKELEEAFLAGKKVEVFGVGTAALVSAIEMIDIKGRKYYPDVSGDAVAFRLKNRLQAIRSGKEKDIYGWNYLITSKGEEKRTNTRS